MHNLPRNGSNSGRISRTLKNIQRQSSQIQEIKNEDSESENKTDHSIRNAKTSSNILTVLNFDGWTRRTVRMQKLEDEAFEVSWEGSKRLECSDKKNVRTNGQRLPFILPGKVNRRSGMRVITKSKCLTCQISTAALNVSANFIFQGGKCANWKDS